MKYEEPGLIIILAMDDDIITTSSPNLTVNTEGNGFGENEGLKFGE